MRIRGDSRFKTAIIKRDGFGCKLCPEWRMSELTIDHIKPIAAGGSVFKVSNMQILCKKCHALKDKDVGSTFVGGRQRFRKVAWTWKGNKRPKSYPHPKTEGLVK